MPIDRINFLINDNFQTQKVNNTTGNEFFNVIKEKLDKVNEKQIQAENKTVEMIKGETKDIHEVMLSVEETRLSLELAVQIRNKLVEAIQELNRMQI